MISICIPVYNFDVSELVIELISQLEGASEIILIDDASVESIRKVNQSLQSPNVKLIELENNIGRAKIRNRFIEYAQNPYLLFLDCDAKIISKEFLSNYRQALINDKKVICGGSIYSEHCPSSKQVLRWKYGTNKESKSAEIRALNTYSSFMTSNFLIEKLLFNEIQFDERITQYGHEDTLFGIKLEEHTIPIKHIQNPVRNDDVDTNDVFIRKSELALESLFQIILFFPDIHQLEKNIAILKLANKMKRWKLQWFFIIFHFLHKGFMKSYLLYSKNPTLTIFNLYKLSYFLSLKKEAE